MSRFYVDGYEVDVDDPLFYQSIEEIDKKLNDLTEYKHDYMFNSPMA